jgi:hypothetical protein
MNHLHAFPLLLVATTSLACTAGKGGTDPQPCAHGAQMLEDGEEVESSDGCMTLACTDGTLVTAEDRRAVVTGDLELASQAAVDEQRCLGVVEGTLRITGTAAELTPIASLYRVGTGLEITASEAVTLDGLGGIGEVGGSITIADNASLTALSFQPQMSVFGDVTIVNNDALASLAGAEFIGQCTTCIASSGQPTELTEHIGAVLEPAGDIGPEPSGGTFFGTIVIAENDLLANVLALANLYSAWSDVTFRNNAALASLTGLQLAEVRGNLEISDHPSMPTADAEAFALGVSVLGTTTVCGNMGGTACP